jgi:hypothetical protein
MSTKTLDVSSWGRFAASSIYEDFLPRLGEEFPDVDESDLVDAIREAWRRVD